MNRTRFNIGDIVYFLVSDEKCIRFKGEVVEKDCEREDVSYWIEKAPKDKTYKIKFIAEYEGDKLINLNFINMDLKVISVTLSAIIKN